MRCNSNSNSTARWRDIFQRLIVHGHDPQAIGQYTLGQVRMYLSAIALQESQNLRSDLSLAVLAARADAKTLERVFDRLDSD